ncbi:hypothetical protein CSA08_01495 [Candidatus Gracilibacteria bacterium]|nr:MAG: hypothetical protein CSA08_01495 [Candidatus Gracilibacteria bacterium]
MIKKILVIIFGFSLIVSQTYAECKIKDGPPGIIKDYFSNVRKVVSNIAKEASNKYTPKSDKGFTRDYINAANSLAGMWNNISNWGFYSSTSRFFVIYPLSNEIPVEVMRDNNLIEKEIENLNKFTKKLVEKGYGNIILTNSCDGVNNCELNGTTVQILGKLIKSTSDLGELFRLSILDEKYTFGGDIILVPENFREVFSNYYNVYTNKDCSDSEGGFMYRIKKSFNKIINNFKSGSEGISKWEQAIALLNRNTDFLGNKDDEIRLLKKELSRQGVSLNNSEAIIQNLKNYHENKGYTWDNNFISNSYDSVKKSSKKLYNTFKKLKTEFSSTFKQWSDLGNKKQTSISELARIDMNLKVSEQIGLEILEKFNAEKDFALSEDISNTNIKGRILNLHIQITQGISTLVKIIPIAEKVCNKQATGLGKCSYR